MFPARVTPAPSSTWTYPVLARVALTLTHTATKMAGRPVCTEGDSVCPRPASPTPLVPGDAQLTPGSLETEPAPMCAAPLPLSLPEGLGSAPRPPPGPVPPTPAVSPAGQCQQDTAGQQGVRDIPAQ